MTPGMRLATFVLLLQLLLLQRGFCFRGNWQMRLKLRQKQQRKSTVPPPTTVSGQLLPPGETSSGAFPYHVTLDPLGGVRLNWTLSPDGARVTFHLHAQVNVDGTLAVGFSDRGQFDQADLLFIWSDKSGAHHFADTWTDSQGIVHTDDKQDFKILSAQKISSPNEPTVVSVTFLRECDTCDVRDYVIDRGTTHVLYLVDDDVWGQKRIDGYDVKAKEIKGFNRVQILKAQIPLQLPPDVQTFEVRSPDVTIPAAETTYWCSIHRLPNDVTSRENHIIQTEPIISEENRGIIHHMEVFHCQMEGEMPDYSGPCTGDAAPFQQLETCRNVIGAWAMGATTFTYPEEAGLAVGATGGDKYSPYVRLEVHFNNPKKLAGHVDRSGLRFYYTPTLRKFNTGIMELGLEYGPKNSIPPREASFVLSGFCVADCTRAALPRTGVYVFAGQLHTHNCGTKVWTRHFRNGVELPELSRDDHFSTHFQEIRLYPKAVHVLPGDALETSCAYDTRNRTNITLSGYSISEEMCVNYVYYYPKTNLEVCKSSIDSKALDSYFRLQAKLSGRSGRDMNLQEQKSVEKQYESIKFDEFETEFLKKVYDMTPLSMQCNQSDGQRFPGSWEGKQQPLILLPLKKKIRDCQKTIRAD